MTSLEDGTEAWRYRAQSPDQTTAEAGEPPHQFERKVAREKKGMRRRDEARLIFSFPSDRPLQKNRFDWIRRGRTLFRDF